MYCFIILYLFFCFSPKFLKKLGENSISLRDCLKDKFAFFVLSLLPTRHFWFCFLVRIQRSLWVQRRQWLRWWSFRPYKFPWWTKLEASSWLHVAKYIQHVELSAAHTLELHCHMHLDDMEMPKTAPERKGECKCQRVSKNLYRFWLNVVYDRGKGTFQTHVCFIIHFSLVTSQIHHICGLKPIGLGAYIFIFYE